jgi:hypothetical protein
VTRECRHFVVCSAQYMCICKVGSELIVQGGIGALVLGGSLLLLFTPGAILEGGIRDVE